MSQLRDRISELATVSIPEPIPGALPSYWFLRMRFHADRAACDKETYCQALSAEGLSIAVSYKAALPHTMDWFVQRRVFGRSGYPWRCPAYSGDPERQFPCPNAHQAMEDHFNLYINESWGPAEIADAAAILDRVDHAYLRKRS